MLSFWLVWWLLSRAPPHINTELYVLVSACSRKVFKSARDYANVLSEVGDTEGLQMLARLKTLMKD